jgi:threonine/homoserine/homoserine lactone efflux protein
MLDQTRHASRYSSVSEGPRGYSLGAFSRSGNETHSTGNGLIADSRRNLYNSGMFDAHRFLLFFAAAVVLAITPGPGIFYVLARSLAGGRREGIQSSLGTFVGGLFHVFAAALGVSAILAASALTFHTVKYAGAAYLVWLGIRMIRTRNVELAVSAAPTSRNAFRQGILTEALNPKTALFFLSFIPQFISAPVGHIFLQFVVLGAISVTLNTTADLVVVLLAAPLEQKLKHNARFRSRQRVASGLGMIGLGAYVALADTK